MWHSKADAPFIFVSSSFLSACLLHRVWYRSQFLAASRHGHWPVLVLFSVCFRYAPFACSATDVRGSLERDRTPGPPSRMGGDLQHSDWFLSPISPAPPLCRTARLTSPHRRCVYFLGDATFPVGACLLYSWISTFASILPLCFSWDFCCRYIGDIEFRCVCRRYFLAVHFLRPGSADVALFEEVL